MQQKINVKNKFFPNKFYNNTLTNTQRIKDLHLNEEEKIKNTILMSNLPF